MTEGTILERQAGGFGIWIIPVFGRKGCGALVVTAGPGAQDSWVLLLGFRSKESNDVLQFMELGSCIWVLVEEIYCVDAFERRVAV